MDEIPETTQMDVNLPKPRTHKVLIGALVVVLALGIVGVAAAVIANRTAQSPGEATANVMPANTMLYVSLNTQADQLPNFNVIADAWKDSKEARMLASALQLGVTQAGLNWEEDIQPWLGQRVALGIVDIGGADQVSADALKYRAPFVILAAQTKDRARAETALMTVFKQISSRSGGSIEIETYRGIPITYLKSKSDATPETGAYATVNDVVVLTLSREQLHTAINAALDGQNLAAQANYTDVMSTLPNQTAGAMYMDYNRYSDLLLEMNQNLSGAFDKLDPGLDPAQAEEFKQQRENLQRQQEAQLAQLREMMKAMGGIGATMSYEPTGIRFDMTAQQDVNKLPEAWRKFYEAQQTSSPNRMFGALPADTIMAADVVLNSNVWDFVFSPDYLNMVLSGLPGDERGDVLTQLDQFQKLVGVDLKTDLLQLLNGEAAFVMLPQSQQRSEFSYSLPFQFAAVFDSSDAAKFTASLDKIFKGASALGDGLKWQSLSGLPYSVILIDGQPALTYGVVDGRVVIGTDSNTLLGIDNADQATLANDVAFKQATGLLPDNRLNTAYLNLQPLWKLIEAEAKSDTTAGSGAALNYLSHFKWMSAGAEAPSNGLTRGSLHIGVGQ